MSKRQLMGQYATAYHDPPPAGRGVRLGQQVTEPPT